MALRALPAAVGANRSTSVQLPDAAMTPAERQPLDASTVYSAAWLPLNPRATNVSGFDPRLVSVTALMLAAPTVADIDSAVADNCNGNNAVPLSPTFAGPGSASPPLPVKVMGRLALRSPAAPAAGRKVKSSTQVPPAGTLGVAQLLVVTAKSAWPDRLKPTAVARGLVMVTLRVCGEASPITVSGNALPGPVTEGCANTLPVPDSATTSAPLGASDATVIDALRAPAAAGVKATLMVQDAPGAMALAVLHVVALTPKSAALAPPTVPVLASVSGAEPVLVMVSTCAADDPSCTLPNPSADGEAAMPAVVPVPLSVTVPGLPAALCAITTLPVAPPAPVGAKRTTNVQLPPAATLPPAAQVLDASRVKPVPDTVMALRLRLAVPGLLKVVLRRSAPPTGAVNVSVVGNAANDGAATVLALPFNDTVAGEPAAECAICKVAGKLPALALLKRTTTLHEPPAATVPEVAQMDEPSSTYSLRENVNAPSVIAALPVLDTVAVAVTAVPAGVAKLSVDGATAKTGKAFAVPERLIVRLRKAGSATKTPAAGAATKLSDTVADLGPDVPVGANRSVTSQEPPLATEVHVVELTVKLVPARPDTLKVKARSRSFATRNVRKVDEPTFTLPKSRLPVPAMTVPTGTSTRPSRTAMRYARMLLRCVVDAEVAPGPKNVLMTPLAVHVKSPRAFLPGRLVSSDVRPVRPSSEI